MVFDQVMTDTALYADVVLPATTFLEHYDFEKGVKDPPAGLDQELKEPKLYRGKFHRTLTLLHLGATKIDGSDPPLTALLAAHQAP